MVFSAPENFISMNKNEEEHIIMKRKRSAYRTKLHHIEDMDVRASQHCMQCGNCTYGARAAVGVHGGCPVMAYTKELEPVGPRGKMQILRALLEGSLEPSQELMDVIAKCTTCNFCNSICHNGFDENISFSSARFTDHANVYEALRADLVEMGFEHLPGHKAILASIANNDNPWQQPRRARTNWARKLKNVKDLSRGNETAEVLLYVGCTGALDAATQPVVTAMVDLLTKAGVDFGYLGDKEVCCGSVAKRIGEVEMYEGLAKRNVEMFNELYDKRGVQTIITTCSGCFKTIFQDYYEEADEVGTIKPEILHSAQFAKRLLEQGKLKFKDSGSDITVTYHDPCHLGRHCHLYETPRELLGSIPGINLVEMNAIKEFSVCCGAGGGMKSGYNDISTGISSTRITEAEATGAEYLISACPFCEQNFRDGIIGVNSKLKVLDVVQLMANAAA
jgi:Fe-S oxidoreductase